MHARAGLRRHQVRARIPPVSPARARKCARRVEPCDHGLECEADILPKSRLRGGSSTCDWADIAARRKAPLSRCASQTQSDRLLGEDAAAFALKSLASR